MIPSCDLNKRIKARSFKKTIKKIQFTPLERDKLPLSKSELTDRNREHCCFRPRGEGNMWIQAKKNPFV